MSGGGWIVDVMQRRRQLMGMQKSVLDTTAKILQYDVRWSRGSLIESVGIAATIIYYIEPKSESRRLINGGLYSQLNIFKDGQYVDYWSIATGREQINANCNGVSATVVTSGIDNAYLYVQGTGEILFAGKNTPYYGHRNISELN